MEKEEQAERTKQILAMTGMKTTIVLGRALEEIEALIKKMGGFIDPHLEINEDIHVQGVLLTVKTSIAFDLEKLKKYLACIEETTPSGPRCECASQSRLQGGNTCL